jgi:hypothetical protein
MADANRPANNGVNVEALIAAREALILLTPPGPRSSGGVLPANEKRQSVMQGGTSWYNCWTIGLSQLSRASLLDARPDDRSVVDRANRKAKILTLKQIASSARPI